MEGDTTKQNYFHQPFLRKDHGGLVEDCKIMFIVKTDSCQILLGESSSGCMNLKCLHAGTEYL